MSSWCTQHSVMTKAAMIDLTCSWYWICRLGWGWAPRSSIRLCQTVTLTLQQRGPLKDDSFGRSCYALSQGRDARRLCSNAGAQPLCEYWFSKDTKASSAPATKPWQSSPHTLQGAVKDA